MDLISGPCSFMKKHTHSIIFGSEKQWQFGSLSYAGDSTPTLISKNGIQQDTPHPPTQIGLFVILSWRQCSYVTTQLFIFFGADPGYNATQLPRSLCMFGLKLPFLLLLFSINVTSHWKCLLIKMMINNTEKSRLKTNWAVILRD